MPKIIQLEITEEVGGKQVKKMTDVLEKTVTYTNHFTKDQLEKMRGEKIAKIMKINEAFADATVAPKINQDKEVLLAQVQKEIDEINQDLTYFNKTNKK